MGTSNIARFYKPAKFPSNDMYNMVKCVNIETYRARMACLDQRENRVILSMLEKILINKIR